VTKRRAMGELESEVLSMLWSADAPLTPGEVLERLKGSIAYTSAMTILTRLWQKGLVERELRGRAYAYQPIVSEAELVARRMQATLDGSSDREAALSRFVGSLSKKDERLLRGIVGNLRSRT
jgi:predicted transcriptional regulator